LHPYASLIDALGAAPANRPFITGGIDEDDQETVTFAELRCRARIEANGFSRDGIAQGDRVVVIMPQGIGAMAESWLRALPFGGQYLVLSENAPGLCPSLGAAGGGRPKHLK